MQSIFTKIVSILAAPILFVQSLFGVTPPEDVQLGAQLPQAVAVFETSLASPISSSATSMTLTANAIRGGGAISGYNCFTVDEGSAQAEVICGTVSGTAVSSLTRGISYANGTTTVSANQFAHRRGANVKITDFPVIQILKAQNNGEEAFENPIKYASGISTTTIASDQNNIASVKYVASVAFDAGAAVQASETAGGYVELATGQEAASTTSSGTVGRLVLPASISTSTKPSSGHYVVVTNSDGNIDGSFISTSTVVSKVFSFGDGSDGDVTIAKNSTTTLTRDMYYNNLTINGTLLTDGYMFFVKDTLSGSGAIRFNGNHATNSVLNVRGTAATSTGSGRFKTVAGTTSAGTLFRSVLGSAGVSGGTGGGNTGSAGGAGGAIIPPQTKLGLFKPSVLTGFDFGSYIGSTTTPPYYLPAGMSGAGGDGSDNRGGGCSTSGIDGVGGPSGASGGIIYFLAKIWSGTFTIQALGGNGGNGGNGFCDGDLESPGGGGGGGGNGGASFATYEIKTWSGSYSLSGGTGGTGGTGAGGGTNGVVGTTGATGTSTEVNINNVY